MLRACFAEAMARELGRDGGFEIVTMPGPDVAEIHLAITDVQESWPVFDALPRFKFADAGLGGLATEGEIVDSLSGVQARGSCRGLAGAEHKVRQEPPRQRAWCDR